MFKARFLPPSTMGSMRDDAIFAPVLIASLANLLIAVKPSTPIIENLEEMFSTSFATPSSFRLFSKFLRALVVSSTPRLNCPLLNRMLTILLSILLMRFAPLSRHYQLFCQI